MGGGNNWAKASTVTIVTTIPKTFVDEINATSQIKQLPGCAACSDETASTMLGVRSIMNQEIKWVSSKRLQQEKTDSSYVVGKFDIIRDMSGFIPGFIISKLIWLYYWPHDVPILDKQPKICSFLIYIYSWIKTMFTWSKHAKKLKGWRIVFY